MKYALSPVARTGQVWPISVDEAKEQLAQDHGADDEYIQRLIEGVTEAVEDAQARVLVRGTFTMTLPDWPADGVIEFPRYPLVSVDSVTYLEEGGSSATTFASSSYRTLLNRLPPRLVLKKGAEWPTADLEAGDPITVTFTAGYADGAVPEGTKHDLTRILVHAYENRNPIEVGTVAVQLPDDLFGVLRERMW